MGEQSAVLLRPEEQDTARTPAALESVQIADTTTGRYLATLMISVYSHAPKIVTSFCTAPASDVKSVNRSQFLYYSKTQDGFSFCEHSVFIKVQDSCLWGWEMLREMLGSTCTDSWAALLAEDDPVIWVKARRLKTKNTFMNLRTHWDQICVCRCFRRRTGSKIRCCAEEVVLLFTCNVVFHFVLFDCTVRSVFITPVTGRKLHVLCLFSSAGQAIKWKDLTLVLSIILLTISSNISVISTSLFWDFLNKVQCVCCWTSIILFPCDIKFILNLKNELQILHIVIFCLQYKFPNSQNTSCNRFLWTVLTVTEVIHSSVSHFSVSVPGWSLSPLTCRGRSHLVENVASAAQTWRLETGWLPPLLPLSLSSCSSLRAEIEWCAEELEAE